ncbi:MAG: hypothetical protein COV91_06085 [Candidatus Taylorbacteria bacterium CG11_big_fil_rev_8_21_14_0_20_46_11]|uniref:DUF2178 domain-containing protein n=1 Tax=Candidatus Taylorbacteria bacterium CG11_big_fil_rev_8_21_14_0_20_46_11 TaxID=1975025 RepID=A0A2H0K9Z3_9BACT|nr:MAG: hypothetical protein COV91_06085 [Candidatus Taylorbacteria bacterium CG11_big_fil_rev_8_21_14_0_20_46_11]
MIKDSLIPLILAVLLFFLFNPFDWWMNGLVYMCVVGAVLVLFGVFALFVWKEKARDEREESHALFAGRTAYLLGGLTLVVGIVVQSFAHAIDPWLPSTLLVMILGKMFALSWSRTRR